jgi:hypothetical protein
MRSIWQRFCASCPIVGCGFSALLASPSCALALVAVAAIAACSGQPNRTACEGVKPAITSFATKGAACAWEVLEPVDTTGASDTTFGSDGQECIPPEGGYWFEVGFGWMGAVIKLSVPRPVGRDLMRFDASEVGLYVNAGGKWCIDWKGIVAVRDANDWFAGVDAECTTDDLRVTAHWEGKRY